MRKIRIIIIVCLVFLSLVACITEEEPEIKSIGQTEIVGVIEDNSFESVNSNYYLSMISSESKKKIYWQIYEALQIRNYNVVLNTDNMEEIKFIFKCVMYDNPELFYVDSYSYKESNEENCIIIYPQYNMSEDRQKIAEQQIREYENSVLNLITEGMSDFDREKVIYDYIAENTKYIEESEYNQSMYSVALGKSVCLGYSKMFQYLCEKVGLECTIVAGKNSENIGHAWNAIKVSGDWYMVDCTNSRGMLVDSNETVSYYLFNISKEQLLRNYSINNIVQSPDCISIKEEYFNKNGLYFDSVDTLYYEKLIREKIEHGEDKLIIRASSDEILNDMYNWCIGERKIFEILGDDTKIEFAKSNEMLTLQITWDKSNLK